MNYKYEQIISKCITETKSLMTITRLSNHINKVKISDQNSMRILKEKPSQVPQERSPNRRLITSEAITKTQI